MHVVAARVHYAARGRREGKPGVLLDRQRVDVATDRDDRGAGAGAGNARNESRRTDALDGDRRDRGDFAREHRRRALLVEGELGMLVQVAPKRHEPIAQLDAELRARRAHRLRRPPGVLCHDTNTFVPVPSRTSDLMVSASMKSVSTVTPSPGASRGTRTIPSASIVHSGVTTSRAQ
jgi:hypothetical protein